MELMKGLVGAFDIIMTSTAGVLIVVVVLPGKLLHHIVKLHYSQY